MAEDKKIARRDSDPWVATTIVPPQVVREPVAPPASAPAETKSGWRRAKAWFGRVTRRSLRLGAKATVAGLGEKARELHDELIDLGDELSPPPRIQVDPKQSLKQLVEVALLNDRLKIVSDMGRLSIECMNGHGWSHLMSLPVPYASGLYDLVAPLLLTKSGWGRLAADCRGHILAVGQATRRLSRLANEKFAAQLPEGSSVPLEMEAARQDAHNALAFVGEILSQLIWAYDQYALGHAPRPEDAPTSDAGKPDRAD